MYSSFQPSSHHPLPPQHGANPPTFVRYSDPRGGAYSHPRPSADTMISRQLSKHKKDIKNNYLKTKTLLKQQTLNEYKFNKIFKILTASIGKLPRDRENDDKYNTKNYMKASLSLYKVGDHLNKQDKLNKSFNKRINELNKVNKLSSIQRFCITYGSYLSQMKENNEEQTIKIQQASKGLKKILFVLNKWNLIETVKIINTGKNTFDLLFEIVSQNEILNIKYVGNIENNWNEIYKPNGNEQIIYCYQTNNGIVGLANNIQLIPFYGQQFNMHGSAQKLFFYLKPRYYRNNNGEDMIN